MPKETWREGQSAEQAASKKDPIIIVVEDDRKVHFSIELLPPEVISAINSLAKRALETPVDSVLREKINNLQIDTIEISQAISRISELKSGVKSAQVELKITELENKIKELTKKISDAYPSIQSTVPITDLSESFRNKVEAQIEKKKTE